MKIEKNRKNKRIVFLFLCLIFLGGMIGGYGFISGASTCGETKETVAVRGEEDIVFRHGDLEENRMAITCNVDWGEEQIPPLLDVLKEKGVCITFFVSGRWAEHHGDLVRRMYLSGHEIESHGYKHQLSTHCSMEEEQAELERTEKVFDKLLGEKPTLYAPPSGDYDEDTVRLCRKMGYKLSLWTADTIDWREGSTETVIVERIVRKPMKGAVMLMHPKPETVKALPQIIDEIRKQRIEIVPMNQLLVVQ